MNLNGDPPTYLDLPIENAELDSGISHDCLSTPGSGPDDHQFSCVTAGAGGTAAAGSSCTFPFTYQDVTYNACTDANAAQLWCSTTPGTLDGSTANSLEPSSIDDKICRLTPPSATVRCVLRTVGKLRVRPALQPCPGWGPQLGGPLRLDR